jgi:hypothetical protein
MGQFLGIFLLISLVLVLVVCVPSLSKKKESKLNSGYGEKFSDSLKILRELSLRARDVEYKQKVHQRKEADRRTASSEMLGVMSSTKSQKNQMRSAPKKSLFRRSKSRQNAVSNNNAPRSIYNQGNNQNSEFLQSLRPVKEVRRQNAATNPKAQTRRPYIPGPTMSSKKREEVQKSAQMSQENFIQAAKWGEVSKVEFNQARGEVLEFSPTRHYVEHHIDSSLARQLEDAKQVVNQLDRVASDLDRSSQLRTVRREVRRMGERR